MISAATLLAVALSGCTGSGGATFEAVDAGEVPIFGTVSGAGTAQLAVSTTTTDGSDFRSAGNYRNSEGVSFTFRVSSSKTTSTALRTKMIRVARTVSGPRCAIFAGEFSNARGLTSKKGISLGFLVTGVDEFTSTDKTYLFIFAGDPETESGYAYAGLSTKGHIQFPNTYSCFD